MRQSSKVDCVVPLRRCNGEENQEEEEEGRGGRVPLHSGLISLIDGGFQQTYKYTLYIYK